ncbi:MAG: hypothetical protein ABW123_12090 [Cystobacter sp.]
MARDSSSSSRQYSSHHGGRSSRSGNTQPPSYLYTPTSSHPTSSGSYAPSSYYPTTSAPYQQTPVTYAPSAPAPAATGSSHLSHRYAAPYVVANMPAIAGQANQVVQVIDQNAQPVLCLSAGACKGVLATWMAANRSHGVQGASEFLGRKLNSDGAGLLRLEDAIDQASATAKAMAGGGMRYRQTSRPQVDPRSTTATARNVLDQMTRSDGFYRLSSTGSPCRTRMARTARMSWACGCRATRASAA